MKRRRVTSEMEGKYIISMPKGTTARSRRILAQQAKKGDQGSDFLTSPNFFKHLKSILVPVYIPIGLWSSINSSEYN